MTDAPGGYPFNAAGGINDKGQLAGNYFTNPTASSGLVGWLYSRDMSSYASFTVPGANAYGTATYGMNNQCQIAGLYYDSTGLSHGFVWNPVTDSSRTVDVPGANGGTVAFGINDFNTAVGSYAIGSTNYGFLLNSSNNITSIMYPGATSTWITEIDDAGDITGSYQDSSGNFHGSYGQSIPEPSSLLLAIIGVLGIAVHAHSRRRRS